MGEVVCWKSIFEYFPCKLSLILTGFSNAESLDSLLLRAFEIQDDIYAAIIKRVVDTKNEHKLKIFKDILTSMLTTTYQSDFNETFLDLVTRLDFMEIEILKMFEHTGRSGSMDVSEGDDGSINMLTSASYKDKIIEKIKGESTHLSTIESHGKYEFYICDLISKALLIDTKTTGNTYNDLAKEGLTHLYITDFGKEFLKFIRNN